MGANRFPQDDICYPFTFIPHAPKFIKQMTGSEIGFICVIDICPMQVIVRQVGGMMLFNCIAFKQVKLNVYCCGFFVLFSSRVWEVLLLGS